MTVAIMELIDGYSSFSSDKFDIINTVTGERLKEKPFVGSKFGPDQYLKVTLNNTDKV